MHLRYWHYEIASIECEVYGAALTDEEFEAPAYSDVPLLCGQCQEND